MTSAATKLLLYLMEESLATSGPRQNLGPGPGAAWKQYGTSKKMINFKIVTVVPISHSLRDHTLREEPTP